MELTRVVLAADKSEAARTAASIALEIGRRSPAKVKLLHVVTARAVAGLPSPEESGSLPLEECTALHQELSVAYGVPGIEICRFAEESRADLIVMGRKKHSERSRLLLGDTGDAVARRSRVPTLFVPIAGTLLRRILVALDGSQRGMSVLEDACDFARAVGASLQIVIVERAPFRQPLHAGTPPATGSSSFQRLMSDCLDRKGLPDVIRTIRRGNIAEEVLAEVAESGSDVLAIGHHRGGPPWAVQAGSTAQGLSHAASCAVLIIPL